MTHLLLSSKYALAKRLVALALIIAGLASLPATAQENSVTIGSTQLKEDAVLWLVPSGNNGQQGLILPVTPKTGFTPSEKGMVIYDPSDDKVYYWNGTDWQDLVGSGSTSLNSIGDLPDVDASGVSTGQVLKWNGSTWVPGSDEAGGGGAGSDDQQLTFDEGTKILSIENGNGVDLSALLSGGAPDNWGTQVVERNNSLEGDGTVGSPLGLAAQGAADGQVLKWNGSGWVPANDDGGAAGATYTAGNGIAIDGANVISNSGDADADPVNELQNLSFDSGTNELSLSDGNTVTIPTGGTDADADPTNELQDISLSGTNLSISDGSTIDLAPIVPPGGTDDQTASEVPYNNTGSGLTATDAQAAIDELASGGTVDTDDQDLILTGDVLTIEDGAGSIDLSTYGDDADADPTNEIDVTSQTGLLVGDGTVINGLAGTADGQVAKWDAGAGSWVAGTDETGGGGSSLWTEHADGIYHQNKMVAIGHTPLTTAKLYVHSSTAGVRDGIYSNVLHPGYKVGVFANAASSDDENTFGMRSQTTSNSTGTAWAYRADMNGSGTGTRYGFFARLHPSGAGDRYGIYTDGEDRNYFSGSVGIGTETPVAKLHVDGDIRSTDLAGTGDRNVMADANGDLIIGAGSGSSLWTQNGSDIHYTTGSVGIGTATPEAPLDVHGDIRLNSNLGSFFIGFPGDENGWDFNTINGGADLQIFSKSPTEEVKRLHFTQSGNVGIGDAIPSAPLHITTASSEVMRHETSTTSGYSTYFNSVGYIGYSGIFTGSSDMDFGTGAGNTLGKVHLTTNAFPKLTVAANGDVGIGTTDPNNNLHIHSNTTTSETRYTTAASGTGIADGLWVGVDDGSNNTAFVWNFENQPLSFGTNSQYRMQITADGNVGIGTTVPNYLLDVRGSIGSNATLYHSDRRWKKNINPIGNGLAKVKQLRGVTYEWKTDQFEEMDFEEGAQVGFIAQEVESILPELVSTGADGYKSVSYANITAVLVEAIKEQQKIIQSQAEKIERIEAQRAADQNNIQAQLNKLKLQIGDLQGASLANGQFETKK